MSRTSVSHRLGALAAALAAGAIGCGAPAADPLLVEAGEPDRRFEVEAELAPAATGRRLTIRVKPSQGWRLEPDAPSRLELAPRPGLVFDPPTQSGEDAAELGEHGLAFASLVTLADHGHRETTASLRFGICEGEDRSCAIVRRTLWIRLPGE